MGEIRIENIFIGFACTGEDSFVLFFVDSKNDDKTSAFYPKDDYDGVDQS